MELNFDEQRLVAEFRNLSLAGQKELLDYATFLVKKADHQQNHAAASGKNQCSLKQAEGRPEAATDPVFTE